MIFTFFLRPLRPLRPFDVAQDMLCGRYSDSLVAALPRWVVRGDPLFSFGCGFAALGSVLPFTHYLATKDYVKLTVDKVVILRQSDKEKMEAKNK